MPAVPLSLRVGIALTGAEFPATSLLPACLPARLDGSSDAGERLAASRQALALGLDRTQHPVVSLVAAL